jgi:uncharacterized protein (DUF2141 family)
MKTLITLLCIFFTQQFFAQEAKTITITVVIENLKTDEGSVLASLSSEKTFLKSNPEYTAKSLIADGKASLVFENIPEGIYGITAFHDENNNQQMDFEPTGMPAENYGISNNKFNPYGPPVWSDARFKAAGETMDLNIRLTR